MVAKRLFDVFVSFMGLVILSPVFLIIAVLIRVSSPGPVIFRQIRAGRHAKPFIFFKFRSMIVNNDNMSITVLGDKRISTIGRFLRRHKLDELPELWNILKGDMSFVGPRPDVPEMTEKIKGEERLILELYPGITGPATLKYCNEEELLASVPDPIRYNDEIIWPDKVRINLDYYRNRSFRGDIILIVKTIFGIKGIIHIIAEESGKLRARAS